MYKFLIIPLLICLPSTTYASVQDLVILVWSKFWSVSCSFSFFVSRSKRSVDLPPDIHNVDDMFQFLYPNADVRVTDYFDMGSSRSSSSDVFQSRGFFSWMENILDQWKTECRRVKNEEENSRAQSSATTDADNGEIKENAQHVIDKNITTGDMSNETKEADKKTQSPIASKDVNEFFRTFGGDIEYFFPLIGFGIPFDGEITLLGFHGFKGVFPYK